MKKTLHKARIHLLIAGITSFIFGITILFFPAISLFSLLCLFAGYMVIKGLALGTGAWQTRREESHWLFLLWYGMLNVATGIVAAAYPGTTLIILGFIVSFNLLFSGILQLIMAFHLHKEIKASGWLVFSGAIALVAGVYIYQVPRIEPSTILLLIAVAALVVSVFLIMLSLTAFDWHKKAKMVDGAKVLQ